MNVQLTPKQIDFLEDVLTFFIEYKTDDLKMDPSPKEEIEFKDDLLTAQSIMKVLQKI